MTTDINKAMKQVEKKRNIYTTTIDKAIMKLYKKVGEEYSKKIAANPNIDNETLKQHEEYFKKEYEKVAKSLESTLKSKMKRMINDTVKAQENNINDLCKKYKLDFGTTFQDKFSKVNEDALRMLVSGKVYKDKVSLSGRIWNNKKKVDEHIAFLLAQKKHPMDIARELEQYINPAARKYTNAEGYKYTGRQVEYNSLRLARTYINHAYQEAARDTSEANPFIKKLIWKSSHHKNMCGLCGSRDGKEYDPKDMPLDHPNGFCSFTYKTDSLEDTATQLKAWMNGESNKDLDKWYKNNFGKNPSSIKNTRIPKPKKEDVFKVNRDYETSLGKKIPKADFDAIMDLVDNSKNKNAQKLWDKLYSRVNVADSYSYRGAYADYYMNVYFNINDVRRGKSFKKPYNTIFHEFGHAIDRMCSISGFFSAKYKDNLFTKTIKKEVDNIVKAKQDELKERYLDIKNIDKDVYKSLTNKAAAYKEVEKYFRKNLEMIELGDFSDMLEGATVGKIQCGIGHGKNYWKQRKEDGLATEAFAEMLRANFAGEESLKVIQKYLPESYKVFEEILEELAENG